ncbi:hypothetical protein [endosymbiont GvMRE of Glomus versiforme]|uniref:hypothetical protein n=1 Tax=endosymbiont GvMRE of Glomus versiforme TaxID=2039283 RepID=UPI000ED3DAC8|nr:hypothetical protein [endosymbiont GvMRE of Glomus versiforme]RHZ36914.1 hypothetical protein GvMRE_I2g107 [endosymbiont GvMRE of Glomus versiforme]
MVGKEKLETCLQILSKFNVSLKDLKKVNSIEAEINSELSNEEKIKVMEENAEIISQISNKSRQIVDEFVDKWVRKEVVPDVEDLETLEKFMSDINESIESMTFSICRIIIKDGSREKQNQIQVLKDKNKELRNKIIAFLFQHEKERIQSNQNNPVQPISPRSQNQPSNNKKDYPWGIIISMGVVIIILLGIVIFLLTKNKKKK